MQYENKMKKNGWLKLGLGYVIFTIGIISRIVLVLFSTNYWLATFFPLIIAVIGILIVINTLNEWDRLCNSERKNQELLRQEILHIILKNIPTRQLH